MFIQSDGALVRKGVEFINADGSPWVWDNWRSGVLGDRWCTYGEIYRTQLWVSTVVNKLARSQARLPLPVYQRDGDGGRQSVRDHPYARLLRNPSSKHDPFSFYRWTVSTLNVFGAAAWGKLRDAGGRPVELVLLHPSALTRNVDRDTGVITWDFRNGLVTIEGIPDHDIVFFHEYHPDDPSKGLSPLEPLRATLQNEDAARRSTSSFWENGARPGVILQHPTNLSTGASKRLVKQWNDIAAGADKHGKTLVLEEGMKADPWILSQEEAQYIETRKLNREEVCAEYDVPPPVVHILDAATYSNITEQMRSMYRDTMAPRLSAFESVLESELRASTRPGASEPDFGDDVFAEYLLDEVLRGDFEARATATTQLIGSGQMTLNEARRLENRAPVDGGDTLFVNSAMVPLERAITGPSGAPAPKAIDMETAAKVALVAATAIGSRHLSGPLPETVIRTVMGRLSRPAAPCEVDPELLIEGLNGHSKTVLGALAAARADGDDMPALRDRIRALAGSQT